MHLDSFKIAVIVIMIVTGSFNTLNFKFQNMQYVSEGEYTNKHYFHPYVQTILMFFGQFLALPLFFIVKYFNKADFDERQQKALEKGKTTDYNILLISVRSFIDIFLTVSQSIALNFLSGSIHQMMRSGSVISTCVFSIIILGMRIKRFQLLSIGLTMCGIVTIGVINLTMENAQTTQQAQNLKGIGYLLMIFVLILNGLQYVYEEWLFSKYHIQPIFMIGMEGAFGIIFSVIMLSIVSHVHCPFGVSACVYDDQSQPYVDRVDVFLRELGEHKQILIAVIIYINTVYICNTSALYVTKTINALARAICQVSRIVLTWVIGLIITETIGQTQENYRWETTEIMPILFKFVGLVLIVSGNLIYNKIIHIERFEEEYKEDEIEHKKIRNEL